MADKKLTEDDKDRVKAFMRMKPTLEDTAAFFEVNPRTIERYIKEHWGLTFVEFRQQNMVHTRHALVRRAIQMAMNGNTAMMIFSLKNLCQWTDKIQHSGDPENPMNGAPDVSILTAEEKLILLNKLKNE